MATGNQARSPSPRFGAGEAGATEASVLQAFLMQLEQQGLVQGEQRGGLEDPRKADEHEKHPDPTAVENAVRKLIAVLREPS